MILLYVISSSSEPLNHGSGALGAVEIYCYVLKIPMFTEHETIVAIFLVALFLSNVSVPSQGMV